MAAQSSAGECRDLIIIPPIGDEYDQLEFQRVIEVVLAREFPGYRFTMLLDRSLRTRSFTVIPVLGDDVFSDAVKFELQASFIPIYLKIAHLLHSLVTPPSSRLH